MTGGPGRDRFVFDEKSGDAVITDFAGDRIDLTAFGFTRSEFEQQVTIEEERFLIDTGWPARMETPQSVTKHTRRKRDRRRARARRRNGGQPAASASPAENTPQSEA